VSETSDRLQRQLEGRYRVERELGRGGMATVYLATDLKHGRQVAIKVLDPELAAAIGPERFKREIEIAARLHHPHILTLFDSGEVGGLLYYVMPYVAGESLRARLERERQLPLEQAIGIAREVADALSYAHSQGIVHRDVKPENVLMQGGHALLADFGIARAWSAAPGAALTATGMTLGTPAYMSPEQAAGSKDLDARSDVYALGCVLYEMLAGQPPFTGATAEILVRQHVAAAPPDVTIARPGVPARVAATIRSALAKSPADRPRSAAQFADALIDNPTVPMTGARTAPTALAAPTAQSRRAFAIGAALAALAVLVVAGWLALRGGGHTPSAPATGAGHARTEIAVLPFQNLSADAQHAYFAGGLQDELLTQLSQVASLKVISRTSVMGYEHTSKPLKTIAAELGVGSIVEGSVQVQGRRLRVTVQLIDAATDEHLWAQHYDRTLDDAFAIQSEVARKIVTSVGAVLTESESGRLQAAPTANAEAYRLYLQGLEYWNRPGLMRENWVSAEQLFERAIRLDPQFALAHAQLSLVHGNQYWLDYVPLSERAGRKASQRAEAEVALRLAPDLPQAHVAMGIAYFFGALDFDRALRELSIAQQGLPNDADLWRWISVVQRRRGHVDEALAAFEKASQLNPRDADTDFDMGGRTFKLARRYGEAIRTFEKALDLAPDLYVAMIERGQTYVLWKGQLDTLRAALERTPASADLGPYGNLEVQRAELLLLARDADGLLQLPRVANDGVLERRNSLVPGSLYAAWAHQLHHEPAAARAAFQLALASMDSALAKNPDDWRLHASRGLALAGLERRADAEREAEWLKRSSIYRNDAIDGPDLAEARARILAQVSGAGPALDEIDKLLSRPAFFSTWSLELDPRWDTLRDQPRFRALLVRYGAK
jgi:serine/threonine-protein kinase